MMVDRERAGLLAWIGAGLVVIAIGMLNWTEQPVEGASFWGYAAAAVTALAAATCLGLALWWLWLTYFNPPPKGGDREEG